MNNIVARLRTRNKLTQQTLADRAHVSRQVITRLEAFTMDNVPDSVASALSDSTENIHYIINEYQHERTEFVSRNRAMLHSNANYRDTVEEAISYAIDMWTRDTSPLALFRGYVLSEYGQPLSQIKFCQFTGLHTAIANRVESGKVPFENIGAYLGILTDFFGVSPAQLKILGELHDRYYLTK